MSETKTKKGHGCLIGIIVFIIFVGAITFGIIQTIEHPELYEEKSKVEEAVGCSQEEAESIEDVLNKCDITDYQDVKADEGLNGAWKKNDKGFRIEIQDGMEVLMWLNKNNKVIILKYDENMLYKKGKVKAKLTDYVLSSEEVTQWEVECQSQVKAMLKSPSSAKFGGWKYGKNKKQIIVQGYVDAENSFGAEIRSQFQFKINRKTEAITSFIFDGQELMQ
ncbi:hypothetical protein [uncultured Eubacterium sp.]|jgi:hypothetical protein|uniref:hypothetical protein n=1 Tax=uncultured Eubacterium sp. TaxID=165185 RepID=UPI0032672F30